MSEKKKSKADKAALKEYMADLETLVDGTLVSIEGWKAVAKDKLNSKMSCAWPHGLELAVAVGEFEDAFRNMMGVFERQVEEHAIMKGEKQQPPGSNN